MYAHPPRQQTHPPLPARTPGARLRRLAAVLAAVTCGLLASAAIVPAAAFAMEVPTRGVASHFRPVCHDRVVAR
jgi:hypothetical protein